MENRKKKIVESVPNYSEGIDAEKIELIVAEIKNTPNTRIVDVQYDTNYNRAVVTFLGTPEAVLNANVAAAKKAITLIDMNNHNGQHPRIGAIDVVPFVPAQNVTIEECIELSIKFAEIMSKEGIPVYLYEESARKLERKNIDNIRIGEYEGLKESFIEKGFDVTDGKIKIWKGFIEDGHHRTKICKELGIKIKDDWIDSKELKDKTKNEVKIWILINQYKRRRN